MSAVRDRRAVLARFVTVGLGFIMSALAGLLGVAAAPAGRRDRTRWRRAVSLFDLPAETPAAISLSERHADGWYQTRTQATIFVDRDGQGYRALSATCTHLGCRVNWDAAAQQFRCPCHGGVYDREGRVVSGPPPAPLRQLAVRVDPKTSEIEVEL
jgi:nitrite reductase/ring-hydroxylating ferredoxin subunit